MIVDTVSQFFVFQDPPLIQSLVAQTGVGSGTLRVAVQILRPGTPDVTGPFMLLVIKSSTLAWAVYDGNQPDHTMSSGQKQRSVRELPSFLEFFGYVFFFGGFLVGPAFEFADYRRFTRGEAPYNKAPTAGMPFARTLFIGAICIGIFLKFGDSWSHSFCVTDEFLAYPLLFRDFIGAWNIKTNQWLRNCIYLRMVHEGKSHPAVASFVTFAASAFWHGFYPGYYLTFLTAALLTAVGITLRRNLRPLFTGRSTLRHYKPVYDMLGWMTTHMAMNYVCGPFPLNKLKLGIRFWSSVHYFIHVGLISILVGLEVKSFGVRKVIRLIGKRVDADFSTTGVQGQVKKEGVGAGVNGVVAGSSSQESKKEN
ncbi:lysophospholipid acyltransferase [Blyttiomyces sp. JEL0837]|nr:lysophospholipid acyltransferase [Blyttiomyces sp. JEL0837]